MSNSIEFKKSIVENAGFVDSSKNIGELGNTILEGIENVLKFRGITKKMEKFGDRNSAMVYSDLKLNEKSLQNNINSGTVEPRFGEAIKSVFFLGKEVNGLIKTISGKANTYISVEKARELEEENLKLYYNENKTKITNFDKFVLLKDKGPYIKDIKEEIFSNYEIDGLEESEFDILNYFYEKGEINIDFIKNVESSFYNSIQKDIGIAKKDNNICKKLKIKFEKYCKLYSDIDNKTTFNFKNLYNSRIELIEILDKKLEND